MEKITNAESNPSDSEKKVSEMPETTHQSESEGENKETGTEGGSAASQLDALRQNILSSTENKEATVAQSSPPTPSPEQPAAEGGSMWAAWGGRVGRVIGWGFKFVGGLFLASFATLFVALEKFSKGGDGKKGAAKGGGGGHHDSPSPKKAHKPSGGGGGSGGGHAASSGSAKKDSHGGHH